MDRITTSRRWVVAGACTQATIEGFQSRGFSRDESEELLRRSVHVAQEARRVFAAEGDRSSRRGRPPALVAASVGSYGAYRADGSEYRHVRIACMNVSSRQLLTGSSCCCCVYAARGLWKIDDERRSEELPQEAAAGAGRRGARPHRLRDDPKQTRSAGKLYYIRVANVFHLQIRCRAIWLPGPYVSLLQVYAELLEENGIRIPAWFSFTSKDGVNAASGDPINECAAVADSCPRVDAVGVNCTAPRFIHGLILSIKKVHHSRSLLRGETNRSIILFGTHGN